MRRTGSIRISLRPPRHFFALSAIKLFCFQASDCQESPLSTEDEETLFRHHRLHQIPGMINVVPLVDRNVIREQLQGNDLQNRQ